MIEPHMLEEIGMNGSLAIPRLPRPDCDKWNYWNSFLFSFTAITTIGICFAVQYKDIGGN